MERKGFYCHTSFLDCITPLTDAERGRLFTACLFYSKTGEAPELCGNERFVFPAVKSQIDRDWETLDQEEPAAVRREYMRSLMADRRKKQKESAESADADTVLTSANIANKVLTSANTANIVLTDANIANKESEKETEKEHPPLNPLKEKAKEKEQESPSITPPPGREKDGFARFWEAYPRKAGKAAAMKSWFRLRPNEALTATILNALSWQSKSSQWTQDDGKYIPYPATWLNQRRWEDEKPKSQEEPEPPASSFDLDTFFQAAVSRRYQSGGKT